MTTVPTHELLNALDERERSARFDRLQQGLGAVWRAMRLNEDKCVDPVDQARARSTDLTAKHPALGFRRPQARAIGEGGRLSPLRWKSRSGSDQVSVNALSAGRCPTGATRRIGWQPAQAARWRAPTVADQQGWWRW